MENYDNMWEILDQYDFVVESDLAHPVHCVLCNRILNDACQGPCGCLYCRCCIESYLQNARKSCPGSHEGSEAVELEMGTNISTDHNINYRISQLQIRCPLKSCNFLSALIDMCKHLKVCDKLPISCPYEPMGCMIQPIVIDQLAEHLQIEIYSHNKLLVQWIMSMKDSNPSPNGGQNDIYMQNELETLFEKLAIVMTKKQALIGDMYCDLKGFQKKIREIGDILISMKQINERNISEIRMLTDANGKRVSHLNDELNGIIRKLQKDLNDHKLCSKKKEIEITELQQKIKKIEERTRQRDQPVKYSLEKIIKIASFRWIIDNIKEIRSDGEEMIYSDFFHSINKEYKMRIWMYPNGNEININENISIQLLAWSENDTGQAGEFPFKADVSVSIKNAMKPDKIYSISQLCLFEKPSIFIYSISEPFHFNYFHLNLAGIFQNDIVVIECIVWIYK